MAKQPEFRKYLPLEEWFRKQPTTKKKDRADLGPVPGIMIVDGTYRFPLFEVSAASTLRRRGL
ncbi:MAG TPA: hypothetical protein VK249_05750 [Anaerolineales bacterium]|nr:hypothetical protein [Anaerolineales bacterium]